MQTIPVMFRATFTYIHIYIYIYMCVCVYIYIHTHIYIHSPFFETSCSNLLLRCRLDCTYFQPKIDIEDGFFTAFSEKFSQSY